MSRAFVNEDKHVEIPFVPPRSDLPAGVNNYVTPFGLNLLLEEKEHLLSELKRLNKGNEHGKLNAIKVINIKLQMLEERITTAKVIDLNNHDNAYVRFGSSVLLLIERTKKERKLQIVGVDEANLKENKIAFTSPLAKVLMNKKIGDKVVLKLKNNESTFKILDIK